MRLTVTDHHLTLTKFDLPAQSAREVDVTSFAELDRCRIKHRHRKDCAKSCRKRHHDGGRRCEQKPAFRRLPMPPPPLTMAAETEKSSRAVRLLARLYEKGTIVDMHVKMAGKSWKFAGYISELVAQGGYLRFGIRVSGPVVMA